MGSPQTIPVVDEDARCRAFLADNLGADGYQVLSAETREQALALLATRPAHLVLADVNGQTLGLAVVPALAALAMLAAPVASASAAASLTGETRSGIATTTSGGAWRGQRHGLGTPRKGPVMCPRQSPSRPAARRGAADPFTAIQCGGARALSQAAVRAVGPRAADQPVAQRARRAAYRSSGLAADH